MPVTSCNAPEARAGVNPSLVLGDTAGPLLIFGVLMADTTKPLSVIPLEELVLGGFAERLQQVFGCMFAITNEYEKLKTLERMFEGKQVRYPYGFVSLTEIDTSQQTYNSHYFVRHGIETFVKSENQLYAVRCMPATFNLEIEYHTNVFLNSARVNASKNPALSAVAFMRRWVMAARGGYTKFELNYGQLKFDINVILTPSVSAPKKENVVEGEQVYVLTTTAQVQGWVSEPILKKAGIVRELRVGVEVGEPTSQAISLGKTFIPRPDQTS